MDLFCFDINKNFLERNIDLILRFPDDYMGYYGIAQMTFWLTWFLMNLFDLLFFINSYSLYFFTNLFGFQRCVILIEFSGVFSIFFIGSFWVFPKYLKRLCWLVLLFPIFLFLVPLTKKWECCFMKQILQISLMTVFLYFKM